MRTTTNTGSFNVKDKSATQSKTDPSFICTAIKESRFYVFTRREPILNSEQGRDMYNERINQPIS
jgi:hypothetical protein